MSSKSLDYTFPRHLITKLISLEKQSTIGYGIKYFSPQCRYLIVNFGDVVETVKLIAARMLASDTSRITDDSGIGLTPGWDSLKQIEILLAVEHEFDIRFVSLDFSKLTTVGRISETVANLSQN